MRIPGLVSVIMPVYGGEEFIATAVRSVLAQTYESIELVVVDDGSPDGSADVVRAFLPDARIKLISQKNAGVAAARNTALAHASGEYIALLDQDDLWLTDKLQKQVRMLEADPAIGLVHSKVQCIDASGSPCPCEGLIWVYPFQGMCAGQLLLGNGIAPLTVLLRASCLDDVGAFDQSFAPADDWELWLRIARKHRFAFLDEVTACYRWHGENVSRDQARMQTTVLRIIDSIRARYPDIAAMVSAEELANARFRAARWAAVEYESTGRRRDARRFWSVAHEANGDFGALLASTGVPSRAREKVHEFVGLRPSLRPPLEWIVRKLTGSTVAKS